MECAAGHAASHQGSTDFSANAQAARDCAVRPFCACLLPPDVSRFAGDYEHVFESTTAGVTIQAPQLDINTVAAGGGSRLFFRSGTSCHCFHGRCCCCCCHTRTVPLFGSTRTHALLLLLPPLPWHALPPGVFQVGPESAGAHPGPVCYRKGGHLAVTDANLALGRILPAFFPKIFGKNEDEPLDADAARLVGPRGAWLPAARRRRAWRVGSQRLASAPPCACEHSSTQLVRRAALEAVAAEVNAHAAAAGQPAKSVDEVAMGFIRVANETMCRPIRALTQMKVRAPMLLKRAWAGWPAHGRRAAASGLAGWLPRTACCHMVQDQSQSHVRVSLAAAGVRRDAARALLLWRRWRAARLRDCRCAGHPLCVCATLCGHPVGRGHRACRGGARGAGERALWSTAPSPDAADTSRLAALGQDRIACLPAQEPCATDLGPDAMPELDRRLDALQDAAAARLQEQGFSQEQVRAALVTREDSTMSRRTACNCCYCLHTAVQRERPPTRSLLLCWLARCADLSAALPEPAVRRHGCPRHDALPP